MTIVEGGTGLIVIDPLSSVGAAEEALALYLAHRPRKPVVAVVYTHSHSDHYGGVKGVTSAADVRRGPDEGVRACRVHGRRGFRVGHRGQCHGPARAVPVRQSVAARGAWERGRRARQERLPRAAGSLDHRADELNRAAGGDPHDRRRRGGVSPRARVGSAGGDAPVLSRNGACSTWRRTSRRRCTTCCRCVEQKCATPGDGRSTSVMRSNGSGPRPRC